MPSPRRRNVYTKRGFLNMTTTAHEDQFTTAPEHVTHQPYDVTAILRQNVADLEKQLQQQRERHAAATARLRDQIERVTSEWERAEAELKEMREQEPVAKVTSTAEFGGGRHFNVQWLKPEAMKSGQTLYTRPIPAPAPAVMNTPGIDYQLKLAGEEMTKARKWSSGNPQLMHIDIAMTAIGCARALLQSAPAAPAVPDGLFSEVLAVLNEQLIFDPPQHFVDAIPKSWDEYERRTYIMYLREAANSMGRRKIIKKARALLQSASVGETK